MSAAERQSKRGQAGEQQEISVTDTRKESLSSSDSLARCR